MTELWNGLVSELFKFGFILIFLSFPFFLIFSTFTMRKLRKLSRKIGGLGTIDFFSGSDIFQVCTTLSLSRRWMEKDDPYGVHPFRANRDFVFDNTSRFEKVIARIVFYTMSSGVFLMAIGTLVNLIGLIIGPLI